MSDHSHDSPRRYFVDGSGQRVLVGLTIEETCEFEALDGLAAVGGGNVLWDESDRLGRNGTAAGLRSRSSTRRPGVSGRLTLGPIDMEIYPLLTKVERFWLSCR
jgi:hypothetical protein